MQHYFTITGLGSESDFSAQRFNMSKAQPNVSLSECSDRHAIDLPRCSLTRDVIDFCPLWDSVLVVSCCVTACPRRAHSVNSVFFLRAHAARELLQLRKLIRRHAA